MLPLSLLKTAQNHPMLVELKNGETYNGHLVSCDNWMNINLREVICTSRNEFGVLGHIGVTEETPPERLGREFWGGILEFVAESRGYGGTRNCC
ncbi:hypothetical protein HGM15179_014939 [Zosterops borbonicus]|uniref:U6 snRNA-associated Sm-like protein LSm4 n=1 Tax=Zosterops borbonicus TaxID=364589 RepID=A0A8K1G5A3_9PASS|nr:hypothetical protein HGM15179_014939 [Zosterops borbonicus]